MYSLRLRIKKNLKDKKKKKKFYSVRALKFYPNEKNLIHGQVTAMISIFSPQIFEMYFNLSSSFFSHLDVSV